MFIIARTSHLTLKNLLLHSTIAFVYITMAKFTKYATFDALKRAANSSENPVADKEKLNAEVQQLALMLNKLRTQRQQGNARKQ